MGLRERLAALLDGDATLGDRSVFELAIPHGEMVDIKIVRGNDWAHGRNYTLHAGDHLHLRPSFERTTCRLMPPVVAASASSPWPLRLPGAAASLVRRAELAALPVLYAQQAALVLILRPFAASGRSTR